jgi:hypothetical protein
LGRVYGASLALGCVAAWHLGRHGWILTGAEFGSLEWRQDNLFAIQPNEPVNLRILPDGHPRA